jgi:DNA polymerase-3 subunit epsilon
MNPYPIPTTLLILDVETTGLDPKTDELIELGAILYSVPHRTSIAQLSTLIPIAATNTAEAINRIPADAARSLTADDLQTTMNLFQTWLDRADYLVAHNASFDRQWLGQPPTPASDKPWLCTFEHFQWPHNEKPTSLINTALNHGIGVSSAHRALTDCQLIAALFDRVDSFDALLDDAIRESFEVKYRAIANVSYEQRDRAKARGYRWDGGRREWYKEIGSSVLSEFIRMENQEAGFTVGVGRTIPAANLPPKHDA